MHDETMPPLAGRQFFCSWSGGKDSCLALYHAIRQGGKPGALLTMMAEENRTSRSHGLSRELLCEQARLLGIPIELHSAAWEGYEEAFLKAARDLKARGMEHGVFGDIDLEPHREWCRRVCGAAGVTALHPLWQRARRELMEEFIDLGFTAVIVVTQADRLGPEWLGRAIGREALAGLEKAGVDACGEEGEYHSVVTGGPIFSAPLALSFREPVLRGGHWHLPVEAGAAPGPD